MNNQEKFGMAATAQDYQNELALIFQQYTGSPYIDVNSGRFHALCAQRYGAGNRMPDCCGVLYSHIRCGDEIMQLPNGNGGNGANLIIRYRLPRPTSGGPCGGPQGGGASSCSPSGSVPQNLNGII